MDRFFSDKYSRGTETEDAFLKLLTEHAARCPLMQPQDYGKLIFQSEFGAEHFAADKKAVLDFIIEELETVGSGSSPLLSEYIGNGFCRFPLSACTSYKAAELLADLFILTARESHGSADGFERKLTLAASLSSEINKWISEWKKKGCPPVHHSEIYRKAYDPHYRLLRTEYAGYFPALLKIKARLAAKTSASVIIGADGRCGSGKTRFAELISKLLPCNILHMDDYYLPLSERAENWTEIPGGNIDLERFLSELLLPIKSDKAAVYRPYDCGTDKIGEAVTLPKRPLTVVEGSYSHHPLLAEHYDLKIFLTCSVQEQKLRLKNREGNRFPEFEERWIPMEENYFKRCKIEESSCVTINTDGFFGT